MSDGYDDQGQAWPVVPSTEVGDAMVAAPAELFSAVMALTVVLHRDPAPPESVALDATGLYCDIPVPGHPAVVEYVINPEPADTRHIVLLCIVWIADRPTEPDSGHTAF
ncbi:hypothetical protein [Streptacidiphilus sp. PAMC 29251]